MELVDREKIELFDFSEKEFISIIEQAKEYVISKIGPFKKTDFSVKLIEKGGGAIDNYIAVSPMSIDILDKKQSLYSLACHEITHVLTETWGEFPSAFFSEAIAYWIGGSYEIKIYGIDAHNFTKILYSIDPELPKPSQMLRSDSFLYMKEAFGSVAKISASFAGYILENFGVEFYRQIFEEAKKYNQKKSVNKDVDENLKNLEQFYDLISQIVGFSKFNELEEEYFNFLNNYKEEIITSDIQKRIDSLLKRHEYPYWHCFWCWRPNNDKNKKCSYCNEGKVH